jgi:NADPH-dependent curcumin reductase CurA
VKDELKRIQPDGFDVFFENTGGHVSDAIYDGHLRKYARVALCGNIANYNNTEPAKIPNPFMNCIYTSVRIQGFIWSDYAEHYPAFLQETLALVKDGKLKYEETVVEGFESTIKAFQGLFKGQNTGKMVVKV